MGMTPDFATGAPTLAQQQNAGKEEGQRLQSNLGKQINAQEEKQNQQPENAEGDKSKDDETEKEEDSDEEQPGQGQPFMPFPNQLSMNQATV